MVDWNGSISRWALFPKDWLIRVFSDARSEENSQCPVVSGYALNHAVIIYASRPVLCTICYKVGLYISDVIHTKKRLNLLTSYSHKYRIR